MTQYATPIYGVTYADDLEPLANYPGITQGVAQSVEAALKRGGIAPPAAADLAALAGRVTVLENARAARCTASGPGVTTTTAIDTVLPFAARTAKSLPSMWAAASPSRLVAPYSGEYDLSVLLAWAVNGTGQRTVSYTINGAGRIYFQTSNAVAVPYGGEMAATARGIVLTAGQYVEVWAKQNSGGNLATGVVSATLSAALL